MDPFLWARLREHAQSCARDAEPAHDFFHVERVVKNALTIARAEKASEAITGTAALLHELYTLPKSHPQSSTAGDVCAEHARDLLVRAGAPADLVEPTCAAIRDHSFSKGVVPDALESRVLQDADRLDALGAIGLARMWATCADMKRPFYAPEDPFCSSRTPDDKSWGLDHVYKKLLVVPERLHLETSRRLAVERVAFLEAFVDQLRSEISDAPRAALTGDAFARIVGEAPDGIVISRRGIVLHANAAAASLLGYDGPAQLVGLPMASFLDEESLATMRRRVQAAQTGEQLVPREYPATRRDGTRITAEIVSSSIEFEGAPAVLAFARDVTERSRLRAQLAHTDRLAAMGVIAAGVAHEINNPLGFMRLATDVFERKLGTADPEMVALTRDLRDGVDRISAIVRDLRLFARYEDEPMGAVDPISALDAAMRMVAHELTPRATVKREFDTLPPVVGVVTRLEQVFVNLLLNAAFSFSDRGTPGDIVIRASHAETMVTIEVTDNGPGMTHEVLTRVFDPFFTTRPAGGGTGLGLSVCRGIIERAGGTLTATSEPGVGTTMRLALPRASNAAIFAAPPPPSRPVPSRRLRVLVVDNDERMAGVVGSLLDGAHDVSGETSAPRALAALVAGADFDAVLCDVSTVELSGLDLCAMLNGVRRELATRFVFVTGGSSLERARPVVTTVSTRLMKPFTALDLTAALAEVEGSIY